MRFHIGPPPPTPDFTPQEDCWTPLKEPRPMMLQIIATPIGIVSGVLIALAWGESSQRFEFGVTITETLNPTFGTLTPLVSVLGIFGLGFFALIAVHEFIHALGYPRFGFTNTTVIAAWPSKMLFYAASLDAVRRNRLLLVFMLPLLVLTILPLVVCRSLGLGSGTLMIISTVNAFVSCGDVVGFFLIATQVPRQAIVRNQGWATWWRKM